MERDAIYTIEEIKEKSRRVFRKSSFVKRAFLFGSYARSEATTKSDLDFEIDTDQEVGIEFFGLYDFLQDEFEKNVDVLTSKEVLQLRDRSIGKDKILLYERENKDYI
ncbi:MAG: nucleotidyltransferase domain-containing protein [Lachnospiraceae bacterium]|nr:nucleotidyltransferase domain-containing protein [Lachnospiraceae bacterium]